MAISPGTQNRLCACARPSIIYLASGDERSRMEDSSFSLQHIADVYQVVFLIASILFFSFVYVYRAYTYICVVIICTPLSLVSAQIMYTHLFLSCNYFYIHVWFYSWYSVFSSVCFIHSQKYNVAFIIATLWSFQELPFSLSQIFHYYVIHFQCCTNTAFSVCILLSFSVITLLPFWIVHFCQT